MESESAASDTLFKHRKLASVQKIANLDKIGEKCNEEIATVLGWKVLVHTNEFNIGEKVIFFEIDSILPSGKKWTKKIKPKNLHVKTKKNYNEIFQGLVMKLDILKKVDNFQKLN